MLGRNVDRAGFSLGRFERVLRPSADLAACMVFFAERLNAGPTVFFNSFKTLFKTCKQGTISVILKTYWIFGGR